MKEETLTPVTTDDLVNMDTFTMNSETQLDILETQPNNSELPDPLMNNGLVVAMDTLPMDSEMHLDILQETQPNILQTPVPNYPESQPARHRKKKSIVWEHFTIETVDIGCRRACCIQCKQSFAYSTGSKVSGTSHLKRHIPKCPYQSNILEKIQSTAYTVPSNTGKRSRKRQKQQTASVPYISFNTDHCREEMVRMIIMHDYPLHTVENSGFIAFVQNLQPQFDMVSFNTVQGDCIATYLREKQNIQKVIEGMHGRVCLTLDLWSSSRTFGYIFVTGQFIDSDWKMHRKLLNVIMEPYPDSDIAFSHSVAACLSDWSMEGKLFSVTINQPLNEAALDNTRDLFSVKNPLILNGQLLLGNCLARSLSSIVQTALTAVNGIVKKVRDSVKYVKTSESREEKFLELKQLQVPSSKNLSMDDLTQWNTTYEMLLTALELKEVFSCFGISDPDYKNNPYEEDWKQIETLCSFIKPLFDMANLLTTSIIPTTNMFFHETWKIQLELARAAASEDPFVSILTKSMHVEFDKYWKSCCFILAIAVVMDPRFKMKLVEFSFSKIYGEEAASYIKIVNEGIHELFREYVDFPLPLTPGYTQETNGTKLENHEGTEVNGVGLMNFDAYIMETTSQLSKSELDQYLKESLLPRVHEFDVVGWWKMNRIKYPTLSKMARDLLSIPVCTVPAGSVFDTVRKEIDGYRCSLRPETMEALVCAKDWLRSVKMENPHPVVKMEVPV